MGIQDSVMLRTGNEWSISGKLLGAVVPQALASCDGGHSECIVTSAVVMSCRLQRMLLASTSFPRWLSSSAINSQLSAVFDRLWQRHFFASAAADDRISQTNVCMFCVVSAACVHQSSDRSVATPVHLTAPHQTCKIKLPSYPIGVYFSSLALSPQ